MAGRAYASDPPPPSPAPPQARTSLSLMGKTSWRGGVQLHKAWSDQEVRLPRSLSLTAFWWLLVSTVSF